jgi:hypothetical protein
MFDEVLETGKHQAIKICDIPQLTPSLPRNVVTMKTEENCYQEVS